MTALQLSANIGGMQIGIIGSGKIGATAARLFVDAGHDVAIANSRGPETLTDIVQDLGERASAATVEDAASSAELVLVAIPFGRYRELPAEALGNRIVVDAMNYYPERDGHIRELDEDATTSTELLAAHAPDARVVKAFNTMMWIGFAPIDTGSLAEGGRCQQPGSSVYVKELRPNEARDLLAEPA
jgi:8-hydroxy-5-deazaflavin:NADPH oxidoreductase